MRKPIWETGILRFSESWLKSILYFKKGFNAPVFSLKATPSENGEYVEIKDRTSQCATTDSCQLIPSSASVALVITPKVLESPANHLTEQPSTYLLHFENCADYIRRNAFAHREIRVNLTEGATQFDSVVRLKTLFENDTKLPFLDDLAFVLENSTDDERIFDIHPRTGVLIIQVSLIFSNLSFYVEKILAFSYAFKIIYL